MYELLLLIPFFGLVLMQNRLEDITILICLLVLLVVAIVLGFLEYR